MGRKTNRLAAVGYRAQSVDMTPKIFTTLQTYDRQTFGADLMAGITVAMVALPLSLAIAIASGAAPETGLVTAIVAGGLISALGGSRVQIGGPTGAFIVVVFGVIAEHGYDGLVLATLMAGVILLVAGLLRAGRLIRLVADRMIGGQHRPNAELLAQGAANLGSGLFGGLPATGAIARTATNVRAGGKTPVAGLVHAVVILIVMLVAAPLAGFMAMPALAGLLILTAWNMSEPHRWRGYLKERRSDRFLMIITLVLTVVTDLALAIGVGVALGLALRLRRRNVPASEWETPDR